MNYLLKNRYESRKPCAYNSRSIDFSVYRFVSLKQMTWNSSTSGVFCFVLFSESTSVCHHAQIKPVARRSKKSLQPCPITHLDDWIREWALDSLSSIRPSEHLWKTLKILDSVLLMCNKKVVSAENDSCYFGVKEESFCENGQNTKEAKPSNEESNHALDTVSGHGNTDRSMLRWFSK